MKRRNRHAVFSGETSKYAERIEQHIIQEGEDKVKVKNVRVLVGKVSLSKAVVNTGRGPDKERMQSYYERLNTFDQSLPQTLGLTEPMKELMKKYDQVLKDTPREMHISMVNNHTGRLDLFFHGTQWFFVDVDYKKKTFKRSCIYPSKDRAMLALKIKRIIWVESL